MPATVTVGEALIAELERRGVDIVFGIPGVHTIELYRGLAASDIRHVTPRHEQGAAFMADGYARVSGRPGVCLVISGPGLTNALTGMAQARADRVPMLVISGVNRTRTLGRGEGHLHELPDQRALAASVALSSRTLSDPGQLADALDEAFRVLSGPRPGPVHLEIPVDVMSARVESPPAVRRSAAKAGEPIRSAHDASSDGTSGKVTGESSDKATGGASGEKTGETSEETSGAESGGANRTSATPGEADVARAVEMCRDARRPVILAGGGCTRAAHALRRLAERLDAPVVATVNARGLMAGHSLDVPSSPSLASVRALVAASDLVLALGTEMGPTDHDMYERGPMPPPARWLRVDTDPEQLARGPRPTFAVRADAGAFADALVDALGSCELLGATEVAEGKSGDASDGASGGECGDASDGGVSGGGVGGARRAATAPSAGSAHGAADESEGAARARATREAALEEIGADYRALLDTLAVLWRALPQATLVGDSTQPVYAGNLHVDAPHPRAWFNSATGYGTLGYAPAAAIGASLGDPGRPVVCLAGDGGLQFSLAELGSARDIDADVAFVVWNSAGYLEIERAMVAAGIEPVGVTPSAPDFVAVAEAYRLPARRVRDDASLERALLELPRPCLVEFDARGR